MLLPYSCAHKTSAFLSLSLSLPLTYSIRATPSWHRNGQECWRKGQLSYNTQGFTGSSPQPHRNGPPPAYTHSLNPHTHLQRHIRLMAIIGLMPPDILLVPECDARRLPTFRNTNAESGTSWMFCSNTAFSKSSSLSPSQERPPDFAAYASYRALMEVKG